MDIFEFSPAEGWPGSIITIRGEGFSSDRDLTHVEIDGVPALIIEAQPEQLLVLAGEETTSGRIAVTVGNVTAVSQHDFVLLPYPEPDDPALAGSPRFFHGPMSGTPKPGLKNQPVLVLFAYPTDEVPSSAATAASLRNTGVSNCAYANRYWDEATYGTTTWRMTFSEWLPLPQKLNTYFWQKSDIDLARVRLIYTTHRALQVDNGRIFETAGGGCIPVGHPNTTSYNYHIGLDTAGANAMALHLAGNLLYVGTDAGRLYAYDVSDLNKPIQIGFLDLANTNIAAMDRYRDRLLVADRNDQILWVDISDPAAMRLDTTVAGSAGWGTAVKVADGRGYVCSGPKLRVYDLSGITPVQLAEFSFGQWPTDVDVSGKRCVVSTDGVGLQLFDVTAAGLTQHKPYKGVPRIRALDLVGSTVFLAANEAGLVTVDISDMDGPVKLGELVTKKPCFNVVVKGTEAVLALGHNLLHSVDIGNPALPRNNHGEGSESGYIPLEEMRGGLQAALNLFKQAKDVNQLFLDALNAWLALPGNSFADLEAYIGIVVVVNNTTTGRELRAKSWPALESFSFYRESLHFSSAKGALYVQARESPTTIAHELGHWICATDSQGNRSCLTDLYEETFADDTVVRGTASAWDLMGHGDLALFTGYYIQEHLQVYEQNDPNNLNVVERVWSPTSNVDEIFYIVAHDAAQTADPSEIHILRLKVAEGLYYYVEVRQPPNGRIFDQSLPALPAGALGAVVVTRVVQDKALSNAYERRIMLHGVLTAPGDQAVDAARNLIVRVQNIYRDRPLTFEVRLLWNQPIAGDPNGTFDATITPWSTDTWESKDIWIQSKKNSDIGAGHTYDYFEGNDRTKPRLSGDKPWVRHLNQIQARIRNTGPGEATGVYVSCYVTSPPGIGDNGDWVVLETKQIASLPGNSDQVITFDWTPDVGEHTCLSVSILPQIGEIATNNNFGQENVAHFESGAASSHQPVILEAAVRSPFTVWRKVDLLVRDLPLGWHAVIDHAWVWLEGKGSRPVRAVIWTDRDSALGEEQDTPAQAQARVEGWTNHDHVVIPIGGILAAVKAVNKIGIDLQIEPAGERIIVYGCLTQPVVGVGITLEVTAETGQAWLFYGVTDTHGCYNIDSEIEFEPGIYTLQTFAAGNAQTGEAESHIVQLEI